MLETLAIFVGLLALAIAGIVAYASTRPDEFAIARSTRIEAPPERVFPHIASLRAMNAWNPFLAPDPNIEITYSGPESGKGAVHTWRGNREVGEGRIEITEAIPSSKVCMQLDMLKPMTARNAVEFTLQSEGSGTTVTWAMKGRQPLMAKIMTIFIDCDRMVGQRFEQGLDSLKGILQR